MFLAFSIKMSVCKTKKEKKKRKSEKQIYERDQWKVMTLSPWQRAFNQWHRDSNPTGAGITGYQVNYLGNLSVNRTQMGP